MTRGTDIMPSCVAQSQFKKARNDTCLKVVVCILSILPTPSVGQTSTAQQGSTSISDGQVTIRLGGRTAGAINSLQWRGMEFIDAYDHGRELQSASSFDGLGECFNPTEAGSVRDGVSSSTTSRVLALSANGSAINVSTQMAFWYGPGEKCNSRGQTSTVPNRLSNHIQYKKVTLKSTAKLGVVNFDIAFKVPEKHDAATFEILTAYMPTKFNSYWGVDAANTKLRNIGAGPGEQTLPVILSTSDRQYAMGAQCWSAQSNITTRITFGRFSFISGHGLGDPVKWNAVNRLTQIDSGSFSYKCVVLVGGLDSVFDGMVRIAKFGAP